MTSLVYPIDILAKKQGEGTTLGSIPALVDGSENYTAIPAYWSDIPTYQADPGVIELKACMSALADYEKRFAKVQSGPDAPLLTQFSDQLDRWASQNAFEGSFEHATDPTNRQGIFQQVWLFSRLSATLAILEPSYTMTSIQRTWFMAVLDAVQDMCGFNSIPPGRPPFEDENGNIWICAIDGFMDAAIALDDAGMKDNVITWLEDYLDYGLDNEGVLTSEKNRQEKFVRYQPYALNSLIPCLEKLKANGYTLSRDRAIKVYNAKELALRGSLDPTFYKAIQARTGSGFDQMAMTTDDWKQCISWMAWSLLTEDDVRYEAAITSLVQGAWMSHYNIEANTTLENQGFNANY